MDEYNLNPIGEDIADGGEQENVDLQEETMDESEDLSDTGEGEGEEPAGDAARQKEDRRQFNASMKAARKSGEKTGEERANAAAKKRISDMRLPNPEKPGTYFQSFEEMEEYSKNLRRSDAEARAKREGRSVEEILEEDENRAFLTRMRQENEAVRAGKKVQSDGGINATLEAHLTEMAERYPNVDVAKLEENKSFRRFAGSRYGKESLADLYEAYTELVGEAGQAATAKTASKSSRATGGNNGKGSGALTSAQKAALQRWNENNPDMKMTEKEFMERG